MYILYNLNMFNTYMIYNVCTDIVIYKLLIFYMIVLLYILAYYKVYNYNTFDIMYEYNMFIV